MDLPAGKRRYTDEEKRQLVANLDIEVAHRTRQFEAWLADRLENFTIHQEGQVSRIPKQVRNMTMREFGQKYGGDIQAALRGFQKERLVAAGADATLGEIDKSMRKRKWVASQESDGDPSSSSQHREDESHRSSKTARMQLLSPKKAGPSTGPGTAQPRPRLVSATNKTPKATRSMPRIPASPSPQKSRIPLNSSSFQFRPSSRSNSPAKPTSKSNIPGAQQPQQHSRVPSSSTFNPSLPPKTPIYPREQTVGATVLRLPRKDENMLSENGSPLANPYEFGLGWFKGIEMAQMDNEDGDETQPNSQESQSSAAHHSRPLKRVKSSIIIRRDPSVLGTMTHSRTDSQASFYTASSQSQSHSRDNSNPNAPHPPNSQPSSSSSQPSQHQPQPSQSSAANRNGPLGAFRFPSSRPLVHNATLPSLHSQSQSSGSRSHYSQSQPQTSLAVPETPQPLNRHGRSFSALVAIPTKDGQILEFDPLQTSPGALDALEGISDSAKKQARMEMGRLVQAAVDKWSIR